MPSKSDHLTKFDEAPIYWEMKSHIDVVIHCYLSDLFALDPNRFDTFSIALEGMIFDYSKHFVTDQTIALFAKMAKDRNLQGRYKDMLTGKRINYTENRAVLHMALRSPVAQDLEIDGENINDFVKNTQQQIKDISHNIRSNKHITDVIHIGVGGSYLGPNLVVEALKPGQDGPNIHFLSNIDGNTINHLLKELNPLKTAVLIASKSFTTTETMECARHVKPWLNTAENLYAITSASDKATSFGVPAENILPMRDWIGGRFSVWSSVGLPIAIANGYETFEELLGGAAIIDKNALSTDYTKNVPFLMAALDTWYRHFLKFEAQAILPYADRLGSLPDYLQQLEMESNGKHADTPVHSILFGSTGTGAQHSFMQALHQGPSIIPCDFIVPVKNKNAPKKLQQRLVANALAQSQALMRGQSNKGGRHKDFPGSRPSSTFLLKELNAKTLGMIMALYEHKTMMQGFIWDINSFDQWGVELGKKLAEEITADLHAKTTSNTHDSSTAGLIRAILKD